MEIILPNHVAITPAGKPSEVPIPVAPVVVCVISINGVLTHKVGVSDPTVTVLIGLTVIVPVADTVPQPPVNGIL